MTIYSTTQFSFLTSVQRFYQPMAVPRNSYLLPLIQWYRRYKGRA